MLGPVYNASHNPPSVAGSVFAELIGTIFMCAGVFAEPDRIPSAFSRIINKVVFSGAGLALVAASVFELYRFGISVWLSVVPFFVVATPLFSFEFHRRLKLHRSSSWPTTQATIEDSKVGEVRTRSSHYFVAAMAYSYETEGEYYSGRYTKRFESETQAWDYVDGVRGRKITVRINPQKMADSLVADSSGEPC